MLTNADEIADYSADKMLTNADFSGCDHSPLPGEKTSVLTVSLLGEQHLVLVLVLRDSLAWLSLRV